MAKGGIVKRGLGPFVASAGEYLVMGELLRRGIVATLTPRNAPDFDILATDRRGTVFIRVKTKLGARCWRWNAQSGNWNAEVFKRKTEQDYCVLVNLSNLAAAPTFYILRTAELEKRLQGIHKNWVEKPGKRGQQRSQTNKIRMLGEADSFLRDVRVNNWQNLGLTFPIAAS